MKQTKTIIPETKLHDGINICKENAQRLYLDAYVLFQSKRYISSYVLWTLSVEEFGKAVLLLKVLQQNRSITEKEYKEIFIEHRPKLGAILMEMVDVLPKEEDRRKTKEWFEEMISQEHLRKLNAIYVNWDKNKGRWSCPMDIEDDDARARAIQSKRTASVVSHLTETMIKTGKI